MSSVKVNRIEVGDGRAISICEGRYSPIWVGRAHHILSADAQLITTTRHRHDLRTGQKSKAQGVVATDRVQGQTL